MKRFHLHVGVENLEKSIQFYSTLFGQDPSKVKLDYAKWMLEDPRINFAISTRVKTRGVDHLGIQVDDATELKEITHRLQEAELKIFDQGETTCCYAQSKKAWVQDPSGIPWETYQTMADAEFFGEEVEVIKNNQSSCCAPKKDENSVTKSSCC